MRIALIVAMARNRVIGRDNALPWHLPGELRHFRELTLGKPVIMGRRTHVSIGRALPGRTNIVISADPRFRVPDSVLRVMSLAEALQCAARIAGRDGVDECMVIGGARVYAECLPLAARIYLTLVDAVIRGDTTLPRWDEREWRELSRVAGARTSADEYDYSHVVLDRIRAADDAGG